VGKIKEFNDHMIRPHEELSYGRRYSYVLRHRKVIEVRVMGTEESHLLTQS